MPVTFNTTIRKDDHVNATGIEIPADVIAALDKGKKPPVKVTIGSYTYHTTVAVMGGHYMMPLSQAHRKASGIEVGDEVEITLEVDTEPRTVAIPEDLAAALAKQPGAAEAFDALAYSKRKEFVRQVEDAKTQETRERRIAGVVVKMGEA